MNRELVLRFSIALLYTALLFVAAILIFLRFLGWLFFASTLPLWVLVPILTIVGLFALLFRAIRPSLLVIVLLFGAYLLSVVFYGWDSMIGRIHDDPQSLSFDITEAALIILLTAHCTFLALRK